MNPVAELALLGVPALAPMVGAIPGAWLGFRRQERARGHILLAAIVALLAIVAVTFYTVAGAKEEMFSRVIMLPLTLLIAIGGAALIVGIPMYMGYLVAYRITAYLSGKGGVGNG